MEVGWNQSLDKLKELRLIIMRADPKAEEKGIADHKKELKDYSTSKSATRFLLDKKLPNSLIKKLIEARMKWNEEAKK